MLKEGQTLELTGTTFRIYTHITIISTIDLTLNAGYKFS